MHTTACLRCIDSEKVKKVPHPVRECPHGSPVQPIVTASIGLYALCSTSNLKTGRVACLLGIKALFYWCIKAVLYWVGYIKAVSVGMTLLHDEKKEKKSST